MVKVPGHDNNSLNIHNHRPIIISLEKSVHHDKMTSHMSKAEVTGHFAVENCCQNIINQASYND